MITINHGTKSFGKQNVFSDISLNINHPGMYALWGESGCGKSTLMNIIAGYDRFDEGSVVSEGTVMTIFQNYELIDQLNVYDNITLGKEFPEGSESMLEVLQLKDLLKQYPSELSGGQKQRVGIARALIHQPSIICCDEPTESLDIENRHIVMDLLKQYSRDHIVIMATHQKEAVDQYADHVIRIVDHGLVFEEGTYSDRTIVKEKEIQYDRKTINTLVHQIISKKNRLFVLLFALLLVLGQASSLIRQVLFYVPDEQSTLIADYVFVKCSDTTLMEQVGLYGPDRILDFTDLRYENQDWQVNIYPYSGNPKGLQISGKDPTGLSVLINQNTAEALFDGKWENQTLPLCMLVSPYVVDVEASVSGVIEEPDTGAMNIYYSMHAMMQYISNQQTREGQDLDRYFLETEDDYQVKVGYDRIPEIFENVKGRRNIQITSPYYEEKLYEKNKGQMYEYMFTAMTFIILIMLSVFVCVVTGKDTITAQKSFVVLMSQNMDEKLIQSCYLKQKLLPVVIVCLVDGLSVLILKMVFPYISAISCLCMSGVELILYILTLYVYGRRLRKEQISTMMKEDI